jgi:two-component system chemotaxis response regulator CheB
MEENLLTSKLIIIGGSAGSLQVLIYILRHLRPDCRVPIVIVMHRSTGNESTLADVLSNVSKLEVKEAEDKETIKGGIIYLAPADYHLLIEKNGSFSLDDSEKVQFSRPSIDVAFQSAADAYGKSLLGILLSGANNDGADGFAEIRRGGGVLIVQDPDKATATAMPQSAIDRGLADYILDEKGIADWINLWV